MRAEAKPEVVEAVRWDGTPEGARSFAMPGVTVEKLSRSRGLILVVDDRPTWLCLKSGDWLVRRPSGEVFRLSAEQFAARYRVLDCAEQQQEIA